jgi:type IV pilus assembly protein PilM
VLDPQAFASVVRSLAPAGSKQRLRKAALILPDYAARVAVLEFDTFPSDPLEQLALARFRVKRTVPFDVESAVIACYPQTRANSKKVDVTVAVMPLETASHYQAPFRAAGFQCGFVTLSALAALSLTADGEPPNASPLLTAKLSGRVLALALFEGAGLRMFRCVELPELSNEEVVDVLAPTLAFSEDELGARPQLLRMVGRGRVDMTVREQWVRELQTPILDVRSRFGAPGESNSGLHGYLESLEVA